MGFSHMSGKATNVEKKISSQSTNGSIFIPHEWLSRRDEIKLPHARRSRKWGSFYELYSVLKVHIDCSQHTESNYSLKIIQTYFSKN